MEKKIKKHRTLKIFRERKAKSVFSVRLSDEDINFLRNFENAADFIHEAIEEQMRKDRDMGVKRPFSREIATEIAEVYVRDFEDVAEENQEKWDEQMGHVLFDITKLTLNAKYKEQRTFPSILDLDMMIEELKSTDAKEFISKIKLKLEDAAGNVPSWNPQKLKPLLEEEIEIVRKIFNEAKILLERRYRKLFKRMPPVGWNESFESGVQEREIIHFKPP